MYSLSEEFRKLPFVKLFIPLALGCAFGCTFPKYWIMALSIDAFFLIALFFVTLLNFFNSYQNRFWFGLILSAFIFLSGFVLSANKLNEYSLPEKALNAKAAIVKVIDIPVKTNSGMRFSAMMECFVNGKQNTETNFKISVQLDSFVEKIKPGDVLYIPSPVKPFTPPVAPMQFNYGRYMLYRGIVGQIYIRHENVKWLYNDNCLWYKILQFRSNLVLRLTNYSFGKNEKSVLASMVLGFAGELDPELRNAYATAGVLHILSVSGMHVGIVYYFLITLLFFMKGNRRIEIIRSIIVILALWFYALLTGFSAPVIRSAAMFSFFAIGTSFNRSGNPFNTLAASALGIILFDPLQITDIGFQLSYAAMAGIFLFFEPINNWIQSPWRVAPAIWKMVAVSIAAMLGTMPLSIFYFHQFPVYFLIANLIIVPLSSLVLYAGILLLAFSFQPIVFSFIAMLADKLLFILNFLVLKSESLPYALIKNLNINALSTVLLYINLLVLLLWLKTKRPLWLYGLLFSLLVLVTNISIMAMLNNERKQIVVYNTSSPALSLINGTSMITFADSAEIPKIRKANQSLIISYNINNEVFINTNTACSMQKILPEGIHFINQPRKGVFIEFCNKKMMLISTAYKQQLKNFNSQDINYIFLPKVQKKHISEYAQNQKVRWFYFIKQPSNYVSLRKSTIYFTGSQGSFLVDL